MIALCTRVAGDFGQVSDAPSGTFASVSAGEDHSCAIDTAGTLACWGYDYYGQVSSGLPTGTFASVTAGLSFSEPCCALFDESKALMISALCAPGMPDSEAQKI